MNGNSGMSILVHPTNRLLTGIYRNDPGKMQLDAQRSRDQAKWETLSPSQKVSDFVRRHEYSVIVGSWAMALTGALRYVMKDP